MTKTAMITYGPGSSAYGTEAGVEVTGTVACDGAVTEMVVTFSNAVIDAAGIDGDEIVRMVTFKRPIRFEWDGATGPDAPAGMDGTLMVPSITAGSIVDLHHP